MKDWKIGLVIVGMLFLSSCVTPPPVEPLPPPQFLFEPPSKEPTFNAVLGITSPSYNPEILIFSLILPEDKIKIKNIVETFTKSTATDFEKIIIAKGCKVTGPFSTLYEMTYPEKEGCDLVIVPTIFITTNYNSAIGILTLSGFMKIEIIEPISGEKMWVKKIDFETVSEQYQFSSYFSRSVHTYYISRDTRPHALQRALEKIYPKVMGTVWNYLDTQEISYLKREGEKVREKKRY
jgi:hypothetical protein